MASSIQIARVAPHRAQQRHYCQRRVQSGCPGRAARARPLVGPSRPIGRLQPLVVAAESGNPLDPEGLFDKVDVPKEGHFERRQRLGTAKERPIPEVDPVKQAAAKERVLTLCANAPGNGLKATPELRAAVLDAINDLDEQNPSASPAKAAAEEGQLDGVWELEYSSSTGNSAGKLGPFVGRVTQEMDYAGRQYVNNVELGPLRLSLRAVWDAKDDFNWRVIFEDLTIKVFGQPVRTIPFASGRSGMWRMSYLDRDLRVLWTTGGKRGEGEPPESVFVLRKVAAKASWLS